MVINHQSIGNYICSKDERIGFSWHQDRSSTLGTGSGGVAHASDAEGPGDELIHQTPIGWVGHVQSQNDFWGAKIEQIQSRSRSHRGKRMNWLNGFSKSSRTWIGLKWWYQTLNHGEDHGRRPKQIRSDPGGDWQCGEFRQSKHMNDCYELMGLRYIYIYMYMYIYMVIYIYDYIYIYVKGNSVTTHE